MQIATSHSLFRAMLGPVTLCGCVLFSLGVLISQEFFADQISPPVLLSIIVLGGTFGLYSLTLVRSRLAVTGSLEAQLNSVNFESQTAPKLVPILESSKTATAWNRIISQVENHSVDSAIERRLQQTGSTRKTDSFARAIRSLSEGIAITDGGGRLSYANPAWRSLLGVAEDDESILGSTIVQPLVAMNYSNWAEESVGLTVGTKPISVYFHLGFSVHDGVHQVSRYPLEGRANEQPGFAWTIKDVTQSSIARDSHEQFLASATHELRTPLTNIRAYTESLLDLEDIDPAQQRKFFNVINSEACRLGRLLNELLDIQQLEAGSMTIQVGAFDVQRMMHEVQEHINPLLGEKNLKLQCKIAPNLKTISADKEKITSCLVNLLGNATKYTPDGGEVRLIAEQQETHVSIAVEDTGIGIAEDELPRIFERFYRCKDERVSSLEGNGLGLAFCMEVARLHGGELTAESKINQGSRFVLRLPIPNME